MGKTSLPNLLPLKLLLVLFTFGATLFLNSANNITTDQLALLELKFHVIHDPLNLLATNWSASASVCNWIGVTCDSIHQRVIALNLSRMGLTGTIQPHLGNLSFLKWLDIRYNNFHGLLPIELANLQKLKYLHLGNNSFSGEIPSWFGYFTKLQSLVLYYNSFTGFIPSTLGNMSKLETLVLNNNDLKGRIPTIIANLSNLKWLSLDHNYLSGNFPSGIFDHLPKLQKLSLSRNKISGTIPSNLFKCKRLVFLSLYYNSLEGSVPLEIANLTMLNQLLLTGNNLEGSIPSSIFNISSLHEIGIGCNKFSIGHLPSDIFDHLPTVRFLDLRQSQLSGIIPTSLFKCKELHYLYLSSNQLEGTVPLDQSNLTSLEILTLDGNNLIGEIPSFIGNMTSLVGLELGDNNLTGRIPSIPPSMHWFEVSNNNLIGEIPSSICNLSSVYGLHLSENNLVGTIPKCIGNLSSTLIEINIKKNSFHGKIPENFAQGCLLQTIYFNNNKLEGSLPLSLANCKDLKLLDVGNNNLSDTFPSWLGDLDQLQVLVLRSNRFYGHINTSDIALNSFNHLCIVDLSHNEFNGNLPKKFLENLHAIKRVYENKVKPEYMIATSADGIYNVDGVSMKIKGLDIELRKLFTSWMALDISGNQFIGEIPEALGELCSLVVLNLSHNSLTGSIPSNLGDLSELESLDLSWNKLEGRIPAQLKDLGFLEVLNLSHNCLVGPIPVGKQFNTFTADAYRENLGLCGFPLESCSKDGKLMKRTLTKDHYVIEFTWKDAMLMGCGCGLVFGFSMGYILFTIQKPRWFIRTGRERKHSKLSSKIKSPRNC